MTFEEEPIRTDGVNSAAGQGLTAAGALMIEHRSIERMIRILSRGTAAAETTGTLAVGLLDAAIDFFRTYADLRHHGKEEKVLFSELSRKELSPEHRTMLRELINDHLTGRELVTDLAALNDRYKATGPSALGQATAASHALCRFYRTHIEKEDKHFFIPAMHYFTGKEQARMLEQFRELDAAVPDDDYKSVFERFDCQQCHTKGEHYAKNIVRKNKEDLVQE